MTLRSLKYHEGDKIVIDGVEYPSSGNASMVDVYNAMSPGERWALNNFIMRHADCTYEKSEWWKEFPITPDREHFTVAISEYSGEITLEVGCWCGWGLLLKEDTAERRFESKELTATRNGQLIQGNYCSGSAEDGEENGSVITFSGPQEMRASRLAFKAHAGAVDKAGAPYIEHPKAVAARVDGDAAKAVAWAHDVLEDTSTTVEDLREEGLTEEVIDGIVAMTRREGEDYLDFVRRAKANPLARQVKLADIIHNMDLSRLDAVDADALRRLEDKYIPALKILLDLD
ncbi:MAG: hypothetical protein IKF96_00570 [Eggerthellaceae bacterium]|nr:hypothetical protein [Eggerthellaceae bacterium]